MNHPAATLCLYASATILASLAGGAFRSLFRLTHTRLQTAISFIAGLILGMALLHVIPLAVEETGSRDPAMAWALAGFQTRLAGLGVAIVIGQFEPAEPGQNHKPTPTTQATHQSTP